MGKQKTANRAGALIDDAKKWKSIDWKYARRQVRRGASAVACRLCRDKGAYRKGCEGAEMEQGESPPISADPLVLRQGIGCETGDLQQGEKDPWH